MHEFAFVELHVKVEELSEVIEVGLAVIVTVGVEVVDAPEHSPGDPSIHFTQRELL